MWLKIFGPEDVFEKICFRISDLQFTTVSRRFKGCVMEMWGLSVSGYDPVFYYSFHNIYKCLPFCLLF